MDHSLIDKIEIGKDRFEVNVTYNFFKYWSGEQKVVVFDGQGIAMALRFLIKKCRWQRENRMEMSTGLKMSAMTV